MPKSEDWSRLAQVLVEIQANTYGESPIEVSSWDHWCATKAKHTDIFMFSNTELLEQMKILTVKVHLINELCY